MNFSANLGFLWTDRPLPDAIRAAANAGFQAVECHWPYDTPTDAVKAALTDTGLPMLSLNTTRGNVTAGENGLSAVPGRECDARDAIDAAVAYANAVGAGQVHVMAGVANGNEAEDTFVANLTYACAKAGPFGIGILIEPLNPFDAPGYFLRDTTQATAIIDAVPADNIKLMFDCYHVARIEGDVITRLRDVFPYVGHIQFASVPDRSAPDEGNLDYADVFKAIRALGYTAPLGAEYKPRGETDRTLGWMKALG